MGHAQVETPSTIVHVDVSGHLTSVLHTAEAQAQYKAWVHGKQSAGIRTSGYVGRGGKTQAREGRSDPSQGEEERGCAELQPYGASSFLLSLPQARERGKEGEPYLEGEEEEGAWGGAEGGTWEGVT